MSDNFIDEIQRLKQLSESHSIDRKTMIAELVDIQIDGMDDGEIVELAKKYIIDQLLKLPLSEIQDQYDYAVGNN
jgi:hypothetical protein